HIGLVHLGHQDRVGGVDHGEQRRPRFHRGTRRGYLGDPRRWSARGGAVQRRQVRVPGEQLFQHAGRLVSGDGPTPLDHPVERRPQRQSIHSGLRQVVRLLGLYPLRGGHGGDRAVQAGDATLHRGRCLPGGGRRRLVLLLGGVDLLAQGSPQRLVGDLLGHLAGLLERGRGGLIGGGLGGDQITRAGDRAAPGRTATRDTRPGGAAGLVDRGERLPRPRQPALGLGRVHHREDVALLHLVAGLDPHLRQGAVRHRGQGGGGGRQHGRRGLHYLHHVAPTDLAEHHVGTVVPAGSGGENQYGDRRRRAPQQSATHQLMLLVDLEP